MRIAVLNDLHPSEFPGAATIAHELACEALKSNVVEFWASSTRLNTISLSPALRERILRVSSRRDLRVSTSFLFRVISEFFSIRSTFWYLLRILHFRPEVVWVHQIGSRFPRTIILINKLFQIRTVVTLHDFSVVLPRKLYPVDLGIGDVDTFIEQLTKHFESLNVAVKTSEPWRFNLAYRVRYFMVRTIYRLADEVICISKMQSQILELLGFPTSGIVPNGINPCECLRLPKLKASVLFAGRPNAKGLNQVIKAVADSGWHLHLAGPNRLNEIAALSLDSSQYTFHGQLHREDLLSLIHRVKLVAVLSECFDVFPTVTLESLRHGTLVITTRTTGNADLVRNISKDLIVEYQAVPSLIRLEYVLKDLSKNNILEELSDLITVNESFHRYSVYLRID